MMLRESTRGGKLGVSEGLQGPLGMREERKERPQQIVFSKAGDKPGDLKPKDSLESEEDLT